MDWAAQSGVAVFRVQLFGSLGFTPEGRCLEQPGATAVLPHTPGDEDVDRSWGDASCDTRVCASLCMESEGGYAH